MRRRLRDLPPAWRAQASQDICRHLAAGMPLPLAGGVASFSALPVEPDLTPWHDEIRRSGRWLAFPRLADEGGLEFRIVESDSDWVDGPHGLRQPDSPRCRRVSAGEIGLLAVPGLAFTSGGARLGRGGGYYDRWLAGLPRSAVTIGIAFSPQIVEAVPLESHDCLVDRVVTERGWLGAGRQPVS